MYVRAYQICGYRMNIQGYSAEAAPLVPLLKLSINLTVLLSKGTAVPPD